MATVPAAPPLAGYTVALATDRRNHDMAGWLAVEGARTVGFRAVQTTPQPDPAAIDAAVRESVAAPAHEVIVSSAFGLRLWLSAARRQGLLDELVAGLSEARLLARNPVTADGLRDAARIVPADRLMVETDAPFLAPTPYRGRRNEPALVVQTAAVLAEVRAESLATVVENTRRNTERLFRMNVTRES